MITKSLLIMAAGMGSRFGGDKQFVPFGPNGETMLDYSIYDAIEFGFDRIIIVVRRNARAMMEMRYSEFFEKHEIIFCDQESDSLPEAFIPPENRTKPYGTAHALMCAAQFIDYPTLVINADDFYGKQTFSRMSAFMNQMDESQTGLAVFPLARTLSSHGSVTRGICQVNSEHDLLAINETYGVELNSDGIIRSGTGIALPANTPTSMNVWAVTSSFIQSALPYFEDFFNRLPDNDLSSELPLPVMINRMIRDNQANIKTIPVDTDWLGVTFRQDMPAVKEKIQLLHDNDTYPPTLFK